MAFRIDDRWLWLGVGVFGLLAAKGIQYAMKDIVRLTELDADQYPNQKDNGGQPEDSISIETLRTLIQSPNPSIASAAQDLIIRRFAKLPNASEILTNDSYSDDEDTRRKARQAVHFLREWGMDMSKSHRENDFDDGMDFASHMPIMDRSEWDMLAEDESGVVARLEELEALSRDLGDQAQFAGWDTFPHERRSRAGDEELERRRRRREAMVLHEGDGGIVEGDIIRPRGR